MVDRGNERRRGDQQGYTGPERRQGGERRDDAERRTPGGNEQFGYNEGTVGGIKGEPRGRREEIEPEDR
jgi:hypothetical protein